MAETVFEILKSRRIVDTDFQIRVIRFFKVPSAALSAGAGGWVVDSAEISTAQFGGTPTWPTIGQSLIAASACIWTSTTWTSASAPLLISIEMDPRSTSKTAIIRLTYETDKIWKD